MMGLRKFLDRRIRLRITRPVLIGGETFGRGAVVEVSHEQEIALIATASAVPAADFTAGHLHVIPRGASVRLVAHRESWRPRNAMTRGARRGCVRLDADAGILAQLHDHAGR